jgi:hypothetical protein
MAGRHLARVVLGDADGSLLLVWTIVGLMGVVWMGARRQGPRSPNPADVLVFVGPVWWIIGIAPVAVAGYESSRHAYLAAAGWGLSLAVVFDVVRSWRPEAAWRRACAGAAGLVLAAYALQLSRGVHEYSELAAVSHQAVQEIQSAVPAAPKGALVILGVPHRSWEWALPFTLRPPFTRTDLTLHAFVISPRALHCCLQQWFDHTRATLSRWSDGPSPDSVTLLHWSEQPGAAGRATSDDYPALPSIARALLEIERPEVLNTTLERLLQELAPQPFSGSRRR